MQAKDIIKSYLEESKLMQLASVRDGKPWICTVYFVADKENNFYWLSHPNRRHSLEFADDPHSAIAVAVKHDQPIIGVQAEGDVSIVEDAVIVKQIMNDYIDKYGNGKDFYDNFLAGTNEHQLYKFTPTSIVLFDEVNFAGDPRQIVQ